MSIIISGRTGAFCIGLELEKLWQQFPDFSPSPNVALHGFADQSFDDHSTFREFDFATVFANDDFATEFGLNVVRKVFSGFLWSTSWVPGLTRFEPGVSWRFAEANLLIVIEVVHDGTACPVWGGDELSLFQSGEGSTTFAW
ncbi:hypothetical protein X760_31305 [Mesorhizobium sp. LSHC422A00]|nr:hypothetical protein X760_31305 [Mesorhizobium sp. LSHC422A00]